jgi:hypothetical protein
MLGCAPREVLPFSTGVIMEPLAVDKIVAALPAARAALAADHWFDAVSAIMTTDTVPKGASRRIAIDGVPVTVTGIAKGSGMIHPDMATMLSFMATDAPIAAAAGEATREIAAASFNCATVDGDTSTNDSFVIAATGKAPMRRSDERDPRFAAIRDAMLAVATELAQAIVRDGEGATKFITISVEDGRDSDECRRVALAIAHSPLVKTAFFASDPNLGRIVCAIGNAGSTTSIRRASASRSTTCIVVDSGGRAASYTEQDGPAGHEERRDHGAGAARPRRRVRDRVDLRLLARLRQHQRGLPKLASRVRQCLRSAILAHLLQRLEGLVERVEGLLPAKPPATDWSAHAFRYRKRAGRGHLEAGPASALDPPRRSRRHRRAEAHDRRQHAPVRRRVAGEQCAPDGSRGTGKSSLVKAMLVKYASKGLRLIEVDKLDLVDLPTSPPRSPRGARRFIVSATT